MDLRDLFRRTEPTPSPEPPCPHRPEGRADDVSCLDCLLAELLETCRDLSGQPSGAPR